MRALLWIDTLLRYDEETQDGHVTSIVDLISKGIVEGCVLKRTFEELSNVSGKDKDLVKWIERRVEILDLSDQDIRRNDIRVIITVEPRQRKFDKLKQRGIKVLSPKDFLDSYDTDTGRLLPFRDRRLSPLQNIRFPTAWIYGFVGLCVVVVLAYFLPRLPGSTSGSSPQPMAVSSSGSSPQPSLPVVNKADNKADIGDCKYNVFFSTAEKIRSACQKIPQTDSNYPGALRNKARALMLLWYGDGEHGKPLKNRDNYLLDDAIKLLDTSVDKSQRQDPKNLFFQGLALSIRHFVLKKSDQEFAVARQAYEEAYNLYLQAPSIEEADYIPMIEIGHYKAKNCNYSDAIAMYKKVLFDAPNHPGALASKGIALFLSENRQRDENSTGSYQPNYKEAKDLLKKTHDILQRSPSVLYNLGSIAASEARYKEAVTHFDNAIGLTPSDHFSYIAWKEKGFALLMDSQASEALKAFNTAIGQIDNNPDYYLLWLGRGIAYWQLGQIKKAEDDFQAAKELYAEKSGVFGLNSIESRYADLNQPVPTSQDVQSSFKNIFGAVSVHANYKEIEDDVVEVEHDRLYPGAKCKLDE